MAPAERCSNPNCRYFPAERGGRCWGCYRWFRAMGEERPRENVEAHIWKWLNKRRRDESVAAAIQALSGGSDGVAKDKLYTVDEAAAYLNVSVRWMRQAIFERRLPTVKLGNLVRIQESALDELIEQGTRPTRRNTGPGRI
jgi:excisionase family DNA binding protein